MLIVPERFNKNALEVRALGTPADTGRQLIGYMCQRAGIPDLGQHDVLDLGCGCRFAEAIINCRLPLKSYTGIDVDAELMDYLSEHVSDARFQFLHVPMRNPGYSPDGEPLTPDYKLPIGDRRFDLACMFSVITHQLPEDAEAIFGILRRHIRSGGQLFFSAKIEPGSFGYREVNPDRPTSFSAYSMDLMTDLLERTGWATSSVAPAEPNGIPIQTSFLCHPVDRN